MGGGGGAVAVWPQYEGNVQAASMTPAGTWGPPVDLAPSAYDDQRAPQVAMNEAGEAVAAWEQLGEQSTIEAAIKAPSGQLGPAEALSPEGSIFTDLDVAVGREGEAVAVWSENPRFSPYGGYRIQASFRPAGGSWGPAATLSETEHESWSPRVAIAPTGRIVATWYGYYNNNGERTVQVAESDGGGWSAARSLSSDSSAWSPRIETSAAGTTVIWEAEDGWIEAATHPAGGGWERPVALSGPESIEPEIGADASGDAVAIWSSGYGEEGEYIESSTLPAGGFWSEPTELSGPLLVESTEPRLAVAPNGETLATWSTWRNPERFIEGAAGFERELEGTTTWEEPSTLSPAGTWAVRAAVALDGEGDGAVAWWDADSSVPQATEFVAPRPAGSTYTGPGVATSGNNAPASGSPQPSGPVPTRRAKVRGGAVLRKGRVYVEVWCPGAGTCKGELRLIAPAGKKAKVAPVTAGQIDFTVPAGGEKSVGLELTPSGRRLLAMAGSRGLHVRLTGDEIEERGLVLRQARRRAKPHPLR